MKKESVPFGGIFAKFPKEDHARVQTAIAELITARRAITLNRVMEVMDGWARRAEEERQREETQALLRAAELSAQAMAPAGWSTYWEQVRADRKAAIEKERRLRQATGERAKALCERMAAR